MRPIPATSLGHAHGLLRAIDSRGRLRTDEFVTEFSLDELFPPDLENALGRLRHFVSYGRAAGLVKEDRGVVELTDVGRRYIRAGDAAAPFEISPQQAEWLRRQLREKHMTDSIFHGLAIGLSLLASCPPGMRVSTMDFGRSMAYLGRAGWDNDNTLLIQGERHLLLLQQIELIDADHRLTPTGEQARGDLTLPIHMSLIDIAAQLNPGGADAVREAAEREWATVAPPPPPVPDAPPVAAEPEDEPEEEEAAYHTVGLSAVEDPTRPPVVPRAEPPAFPGPAATGGLGRRPRRLRSARRSAGLRDRIGPRRALEHAAAERPSGVATGGAGRACRVGRPAGVAAAGRPWRGEPRRRRRRRRWRPWSRRPSRSAGVAAARRARESPAGPAASAPAASPPPIVIDKTVVTPGRTPPFVDAWSIRAAAESAGLRFPDAVHANIAGALAAGKHVLLTGKRGAGKTALALAVARAAAQAGRADGATVVTAAPSNELVVDAASRGRWVIADELDQADPDAALAPLSTLLAGVPITLGDDEAVPADGWRLIATWNGDAPPKAAILRRFAVVEVLPPASDELRRLLDEAANGDAVAIRAAERLNEAGLGAGVLIDAARHAATRHAVAPADEATLAQELFAAYVAPLQP